MHDRQVTDERAGRPFSLVKPAQAAETPTISPVKARSRDFYAPNSEDLGPNDLAIAEGHQLADELARRVGDARILCRAELFRGEIRLDESSGGAA